jgi:hypothetical protein
MKIVLALTLLVCGLYLVGGAFVAKFFTGAMTLGGSGKLLTKNNIMGCIGGLLTLGSILVILF